MGLVGFEPMISVGERLHTQALDSEATVIGYVLSSGATALQGFGLQSGRRRSAKLVPTFLRIEGCHVVSATDPHGR